MPTPAFLRQKQSGLTLVELLLVIAIIGIISSISVMSFISFNKRQRLVAAANDVNAALTQAKSQAQSQVKPQKCIDEDTRLTGYRVRFAQGPTNPCPDGAGTCIMVIPMCNESEQTELAKTKRLPSDIVIAYSNGNFFTFRVLSGEVKEVESVTGHTVSVSNGTEAITIRVFRDGRVSLNP